tara:strand:+ start:1440 stop:2003 length:564 start_codon:yes stop_codon:yes gene_type:complete
MAFKMRSGNSPLFKIMGSSPAKDLDPHTGEDGHTHEGYTAGDERLISDEMGVKTYRTDYTKPGGGSGGFKNPAKPGQTWDEWLQTPEGKNWKEKNPGGEYHTIRKEHMPLEPIPVLPPQMPPSEISMDPVLPKPYRERKKKKKGLISKTKKRKLKKWWKRTTTKAAGTTKLTCDASGNCAPTDDLVV